MTNEEKHIIKEWTMENVNSFDVIPEDEGNDDALKYNLIHLLYDGKDFKPYAYEEDQDAEIKAWGR